VAVRLAITLQFLSSGDSYHSLMYMFKISKQSILQIVPEVSHNNNLKTVYCLNSLSRIDTSPHVCIRSEFKIIKLHYKLH